MDLRVHFDGYWDPETRKRVEDAVRSCIGEPPADETWAISIVAGFSLQYFEVQLRTPDQTRSHLFFNGVEKLPKAITDWINIYPLR